MTRRYSGLLVLGFVGMAVQALAGAGPKPREAAAASPAEYDAVERFLSQTERPPVAYEARRRLEASSEKLNESAWMEAITSYDPRRGFRYTVVAQGGSQRIARRVLQGVLEAERENSALEEWRKGTLSRSNYEFGFRGRTSDGMLKMELIPRRRDVRLVLGSALLTASAGDLVRVEGRLSKSPSFWVRWVDVSRTYAPVGGLMMPVGIESTADVRFAGVSRFSMTYDYQTVDGHAVNAAPPSDVASLFAHPAPQP